MIVDTATQYGIFVQKLFKKGGKFLFIIFLLKQFFAKKSPRSLQTQILSQFL